MSAESDPGLIKQMLEWAWAGVLALGGLVFKGVKEDVAKKADKDAVAALAEEVKRQREIDAKLFDQIKEESDKTTVQFTQVAAQINKSHIELLNAIHDKKK